VRPAAAEAVAQSLGSTWTTDYRALVEDPAIDAVVICTPEFLHAEQTIAAARSGKHVLCEKPMARTLAEADAMLAAARAANVRLMIAHSRRFTPRYRRAHELLESGAIGQPVLIREHERRARAPVAVGASPSRSGWRPDPDKPTTWYAQAGYSAGTIFHIGVHEMDLLRWFAGAEARSVYMESTITDPSQEVPDTVALHIRFDNGVLAACDIFNQAPIGYPNHHDFQVFGTLGMLRARDLDSLALTCFDDDGAHFPSASASLLLVSDAYALEQRLFFESILQGTPVPLDPAEGRAALELALAAIRSSATGQHVTLPLAESR
jgi:myo-inositol 2-dehydrogenase/D-chiro-inositol 1-dehydrogenase/scyllo-inositol 2-dehydrogenase (NAD+)